MREPQTNDVAVELNRPREVGRREVRVEQAARGHASSGSRRLEGINAR
jgi:hypothetical protein